MQRSNKRNDRITPAAYARLRGLNRSTISRQIQSGVIKTIGGMIDVDQADRDRRNNLDGRRGRRKTVTPESKGPRAPKVDRAQMIEELRATWLDAIRERAARILPELARRLVLPEHVVISAHDVFDTVLARCGADPDYLNGDGYEWPPFDTPGLREASASVQDEADKFLDRLEHMLDEFAPVPQPPSMARR